MWIRAEGTRNGEACIGNELSHLVPEAGKGQIVLKCN